MMYFALVIIMLVFQIWSGGKFFRASNITNLFNQAAYVGVLAIGMTLILILKHIDLSVGYVAGFTGALAAILMQREGVNEWLAIIIVLLVGLVIGLYQGLTVTRLGVPAFVVTLAGMFIFRGLLSRTLAESGTVVVSQKGFLALCNGFIPDIPVKTGIHMVTMIVGVLGVIIVILSQIKNRKNKQKYQFEVVSTPIFVIGMVLVSAVILAIYYGFSVDGKECEFICVLFHPSLLRVNPGIFKKMAEPITSNEGIEYLLFDGRKNGDDQLIATCMQEISALQECAAPGYEWEVLGNLSRLWSVIFRRCKDIPTEKGNKPLADRHLQREMVSYIFSHFAEPLSLEEIAASGNVSRSKCCLIFKKYLGESPIDFVNSYRLEKSCQQLRNTGKSITEIALSCGFNHSSYYTKLFTRKYGCTPSQYRNME